ncbi:carbonic anhydrase 15-like [Teleopsis dalmanni]|uniref:carbonic anhydrase 15-like n=1 Tax=Teleopsis dalmanni TaxID=139649 RepID=UPI0018CE771E|nr:carbonic anhydrase 15-like [Teleopsis dalmanni]
MVAIVGADRVLDNTIGDTRADDSWSYDNTEDWGINYPQCDGIRQSPIHLISSNSVIMPFPILRFINYNVPLSGKLTLENNGHTISMPIPSTRNGIRPYISGGSLKSRYEAIGVHFHWGSPSIKGSEHMINNRRYDIEMHIVHRNVKYSTDEDARKNSDGFAVLGIMLTAVSNPVRQFTAFTKIFRKLPSLIDYKSRSFINGQISLNQLMGNLNTRSFFTYQGMIVKTEPSECNPITVIKGREDSTS